MGLFFVIIDYVYVRTPVKFKFMFMGKVPGVGISEEVKK